MGRRFENSSFTGLINLLISIHILTAYKCRFLFLK